VFNVIFATKFDKITNMNIHDFLPQLPDMIKELPFAITVCDTEGTILYMNDKSASTFQKYGGADIIGTNLFLYHTGASALKLRELLDTQTKHVYTIEKNGIRKMIYQSPWFKEGNFAGLIELSLEIPMEMPHYNRQ
jgi:transcriptional regulator with PAS, ATPase and Fis domain